MVVVKYSDIINNNNNLDEIQPEGGSLFTSSKEPIRSEIDSAVEQDGKKHTLSNEPVTCIDIDKLIKNDAENLEYTPEGLFEIIKKSSLVGEIIRFINHLPSKSFVDVFNAEGFSPLELAISKGSEAALLMLDKYYEDPNNVINPTNMFGRSLLGFSQAFGNSRVSLMISRKITLTNQESKIFIADEIPGESVTLMKDQNKIEKNDGSVVYSKPVSNIANPQIPHIPQKNESFSNDLYFHLTQAVHFGDYELFTDIFSKIDLLDSGHYSTNINIIFSLLHQAFIFNRLNMANDLLRIVKKKIYWVPQLVEFAILNNCADFLNFILDDVIQERKRNPLKAQYTSSHPVNFAAKNGKCEMLQILCDRIGGEAKQKCFIKGITGITTLHYAAESNQLEVLKFIWSKLDVKSVDDVNPPNRALRTPLHFAVKEKNIDIVKAIYDLMPYANYHQINPRGPFGLTPLHIAADNSDFDIFMIILQKLPSIDIVKSLNQKDQSGKTPLYIAINNKNLNIVRECLKYEGVHLNRIGSSSPLEVFQPRKRLKMSGLIIRDLLRENGCLEHRLQNALGGSVVQAKQSVHASYTEITLQKSLMKLKSGKSLDDIESAYQLFSSYCNLDNQEYLNDLRSIEINSATFSRPLIVGALSTVTAEKSVEVFHDAIKYKFRQMAATETYFKDFKERCGLIWLIVHDPIEQTKFYDIRVTTNPEFHKISIDNLRKKLLVQLIETRFEYEPVVGEDNETINEDPNNSHNSDSQAFLVPQNRYLNALMSSRPSCPGGTCNFVIDCFNFLHPDIVVLEAELPLAVDVTPGTKGMMEHILPIIIAKAFFLKPELFEGILDSVLGVSEDTLTENDIRLYIMNVLNKSNHPVIAKFLGAMKSFIISNPNILKDKNINIDLPLGFTLLEDVLSDFKIGSLSDALLQGYKEYYQSQVRSGVINLQNEETLKDFSLRCKLQEAFKDCDILQEKWFQEVESFDSRIRIARFLNSQLDAAAVQRSMVHDASKQQAQILKFSLKKPLAAERTPVSDENGVESLESTKKRKKMRIV